MADLDDLISGLPIDQIAQQFGIDASTAQSAVAAVIPALAGGMEANAQDAAGAESLQKALQKHDGAILDGGVNIDDVDTQDGQKIVQHVFGDKSDQVTQQLGGVGGLDSGMVAKLLPMLAPVVMGYIAKQMRDGSGSAGGSGGGLTDILGGLVPGGSGGGGLLDMLGGLLKGR